jgi:TatD DNase family protein
MIAYADIGVNLLHPQFADDREAILNRAKQTGVDKILITATDIATSKAALNACQPGFCYATAGVHPHDAGAVAGDWMTDLENISGDDRVCAVGETGLDFNRNFSPVEDQITCFDAQINLACKIQKPLFVHDRESDGEVLRILSAYTDRLPKVVIHCFTGTENDLADYLSAGFYIGITGWVTEKKRGAPLRAMVPSIPLAQLMVETDAPFLRPHNIVPANSNDATAVPKTRRNEPALLPNVVASLAELRDESATEIAHATRANAIACFDLAD